MMYMSIEEIFYHNKDMSLAWHLKGRKVGLEHIDTLKIYITEYMRADACLKCI